MLSILWHFRTEESFLNFHFRLPFDSYPVPWRIFEKYMAALNCCQNYVMWQILGTSDKLGSCQVVWKVLKGLEEYLTGIRCLEKTGTAVKWQHFTDQHLEAVRQFPSALKILKWMSSTLVWIMWQLSSALKFLWQLSCALKTKWKPLEKMHSARKVIKSR